MNENSLENCEVSVAFECLKRNSHTNSFSFSETSEQSIKEIRVRYANSTLHQAYFKGTINIIQEVLEK